MNDTISLKNIEALRIEGSELYGCNQEWYSKPWQRLSGCGPTTASMIALYQVHDHQGPKTLEEAKAMMNAVWEYVTPGFGGINRLDRFFKGYDAFLASRQLKHACFALEIPKLKTQRPSLTSVTEFLTKGLLADAPIAFLNLNNGKVHNLEAYHWVLITGIDMIDAHHVMAHILDGGERLVIDLGLWLETTTSSGGFIYYTT